MHIPRSPSDEAFASREPIKNARFRLVSRSFILRPSIALLLPRAVSALLRWYLRFNPLRCGPIDPASLPALPERFQLLVKALKLRKTHQ